MNSAVNIHSVKAAEKLSAPLNMTILSARAGWQPEKQTRKPKQKNKQNNLKESGT